jgi:hypothetical protein
VIWRKKGLHILVVFSSAFGEIQEKFIFYQGLRLCACDCNHDQISFEQFPLDIDISFGLIVPFHWF